MVAAGGRGRLAGGCDLWRDGWVEVVDHNLDRLVRDEVGHLEGRGPAGAAPV